jgi:hypothetical protein
MSLGDGKMHFALSPAMLGIVCAGVLALIVAGFALGRATAPTGRPQDPGQAQAGTGGPGGVVGVPNGPRNGSANGNGTARQADLRLSPDDSPRRPGHWYLVIQGAIASREHAEAVKAFLHEHEVPCTIERDGRRYQLVGLHGFPQRDAEQVRLYREGIARLGRKYRAESLPGRYNFDGAWMRKHTN